MRRLISTLVFLQFTLLFFSCRDQNMNTGEGVLKGKISIGPICPVEKIPPDPACLPTMETYNAYLTAVWTPDKKIKIKDLLPNSDGFYQFDFPAGTYLIDFSESRTNRVGSSNLPALIKIAPLDTTKFNVSIDTGIR